MTTTNTTRMTSTNVTRDRGIRSLRFLILVARPTQQPNPVPQRTVQQDRDPVGQRQHDRHHHCGLDNEAEPG